MIVPPEVKTTTFSFIYLDHYKFMHLSGEYPMICLSSRIGSVFNFGDLFKSIPMYDPAV